MRSEVIREETKNYGYKKNLILIGIVIGLTAIPLFIAKNVEFAGADDKAKIAITEIDTNYKPWFSPIWEPPSGEIASLLFALQAAIGAGIVGYGVGFMRGKSKKQDGQSN
jgi:cobalt/nickel transport protein